MRVYKDLLITLAALTAAPEAFATGETVGPFTLSELKVDGGHVGLMLNASFTDNQCGLGTVRHVMLLASDPGFVQLYAAALTAMNSGKQVKVWVEGCSSATDNYWGTRWPLVRNVSVLAQ